MSKLSSLRAASSLKDVATLLNFRPSALSYILYKMPPATKYYVFLVPKRSGGQRTISAPCDALKRLQRNLADLLQDCVDELATAKRRSDRASHGFTRKRSIITNARQHRHRRWVFNLDLEDFFPSINFGRILGYFIKNKDFELHPSAATVLAQIACSGNSLPQGSPCSPVIANLVAHLLDMRLVKLAGDLGCTYSRYADDLTFSTNKKDFPQDIAVPSDIDGQGAHLWLPGDSVRGVVERSGFRFNEKKTHVMYRSSRQEVTGLVVNQKISVKSTYRHSVRAMVHKLVKSGSYEVLGPVQKDGLTVIEKRSGTFDELHGMLGFIDSIDVYNRNDASTNGPKTSTEKTYQQFLFYRTFYAAKCPVVICEGETDNVYLTHAIRSLAAEFPELAEVLPNNKIRLIPRLFKYSQSSTARLIGLMGGGSSLLKSFIARYNKEIGGFGGPGPAHPVIVLFDDDSGGAGIWSAIKSVTRRPRTDGEPFVHLIKNLYAVPTPGEGSKIEDFFDASTKALKIDGKSFKDANEFDVEKHYGKKVFAHRIVRPNADTLDFSGFRPLLTNLAAAIREHEAKVIQ
jgi:RNA-directed DNA polymerase